MLDSLRWLFSIGDFMSHGHCYLWDPGLVRLHGISDLFIGGSYVAISATLVYLVRRAKNDIPFFVDVSGVRDIHHCVRLHSPG